MSIPFLDLLGDALPVPKGVTTTSSPGADGLLDSSALTLALTSENNLSNSDDMMGWPCALRAAAGWNLSVAPGVGSTLGGTAG